MDKYLMLINQLEKKISSLENKLKNIQSDVLEKKQLVVSLKSKNTIDDNRISVNNSKINYKNDIKNHYKKILKNFMITFLILFSLTAIILALPNLVTGTLTGLAVKLIASFGVWASLVGGTYIGVKNSEKKYFDSIDFESLTKDNKDLNTNINLRNMEIKTLTKKIEQLENLLDRIQNIIKEKRTELSEIESKRRTIVNDILSELVEQRIAETEHLSEKPKQMIINK